jgi:hypothetical protein
VKDVRLVFFAAPSRRARVALAGADVESEARVDERDGFAHCRVELLAGDPRIPNLLARIDALGETPLVRADRRWSSREVEAADRLLLRIRTTGLDGGIALGQRYDRAAACPTCGAGSVPLSPLIADLPRMGRKHLDATAYDGLLVVSSTLAAALEEDALTGFEIAPVRSRSPRYPTDGQRWLAVTGELPPCRSDSVLRKVDLCPECGRGGHYDAYSESTELRYDAIDGARTDLARTYEYWGDWRAFPPGQRTGGAQFIVVSQRLRRTFVRMGVRRISFEPLIVGP